MALPGALQTAQQVLTAPVNAAGSLFAKLAKEITDVNAPMSAAIANLNSFNKAATSLGGAIGEFVRAANPAVFQRFAFAARDLQASIGLALMPAMDAATKVVRGLADVFFTVARPIAKLMDAVLKPLGDIVVTLVNTFGPILNIFGQLIGVVAEVVAPFAKLLASFIQIVALPIEIVFRVLAKVLEVLLIPLRLIAAVFNFVVDAISGFIKRIRGLFGFKDTSGSSTGAAVTNAQLGSVEGFQSKALTAAFMSGNEPKTESDLLTTIIEVLTKLPEKIAEAITRFIKGGAAKLGTAALGVEDLAKEAKEANVSRGRFVAMKIADSSNTDIAFNLGAALRGGF